MHLLSVNGSTLLTTLIASSMVTSDTYFYVLFQLLVVSHASSSEELAAAGQEITPEMGRWSGFSSLKDIFTKVTATSQNLWNSLTSQQDSVDFIDPGSYVPDVSVISQDPERVRFLLYFDSNDPDKYDILEYKNLNSVKRSHYNPSKPVKILVHGFLNDFGGAFPQNVKNAYLAKKSEKDVNIIVVDWGPLAIPKAPYIADGFYAFAVKNTWIVGERLGEFIFWLKQSNLVNVSTVHVLGFSLGSHVAGKAGDLVKEKAGKPVARITAMTGKALDPAGPAFYTGKFARKVTKNDADFVDAVHTNAGKLGLLQDVGKTDFYVNGGLAQPGCFKFDTIKTALHALSGSCSHLMATKFFAKTILIGERKPKELETCSCGTLAKYTLKWNCCDKKVIFGEYSPASTSGVHYIRYGL